MDLNAAIAVLMGADRAAVLQALEKDAGPIHQAVFQKGHDVGYGKKAGELSTAQGKVTELETKITKLETDLTEARKDKPDLAAVHKQYQDAARETTEKHQQEVTRLTGLLQGSAIESAVRDLRSKLVVKGVHPDMAQVLTEKAELRQRFKVDDDRSVTILQAGKDIPIVASGTMAALDVLVDEVFKTVDAKFITANTDAGSGDRGTGTPTGEALYDKIRKETVEQGAAEAGQRKQALAAAGLS